MEFKQTEIKDIPQVMEIIKAAQNYLKSKRIDQWQHNYPNSETIKEDINNHNSYIIEVGNKIIATAAIIFGDDPTYDYIESGNWLSSGKYGVIHRAAVKEEYKGRGIASKIFSKTFELAKERGITSIRIDTHPDNIAMKRAIKKADFKYCGIIYTKSGGKRLAYEKIL